MKRERTWRSGIATNWKEVSWLCLAFAKTTFAQDAWPGDRNAKKVQASGSDQDHNHGQARLRRLRKNRRHLGSPSHVHVLRACGLLRFVEEQARHQTLPSHQPPCHALG